MNRRRPKVIALAAATSALAATAALAAPAGTSTGPSTPTHPYVLPVADGVGTKSLLTVSDAGSAGNGYEMVGIPDGLGAYEKKGSRDFTLFMNQELRSSQGVVRRHGQPGAFVSELDIDSDSFQVESGRDLIDPGVRFWDYPSQSYRTTPSTAGVNPRDATDTFLAQAAAFARFCSGSLTDPKALFNNQTNRGYKGQMYFANEENGDEGRLFGVTTDGQAQQLPRQGLLSWENTNLAPTEGDTTVTLGNEDGGDGQLWLYKGTKRNTGNPFDRAGFTNGRNYVIDLADESVSNDASFRSKFGKHTPAKFTVGTAGEEVNWDRSGKRQNEEAKAKGLSLNRIEDGSFDPQHPNDFYFDTTEGSPGTEPSEPSVTRDGGGVWRLRFKDVSKPEKGGTLTLLLDGTEAPFLNKPDNVVVDGKGNLLIQEDPGANAHVSRIVAYRIKDGARGVLAEFDRSKFRAGQPGFITEDEESSGIIDAKKVIGPGWFLFDAQVHKSNPEADKVEYGQLLAMHVRRFRDVYTIDGDS